MRRFSLSVCVAVVAAAVVGCSRESLPPPDGQLIKDADHFTEMVMPPGWKVIGPEKPDQVRRYVALSPDEKQALIVYALHGRGLLGKEPNEIWELNEKLISARLRGDKRVSTNPFTLRARYGPSPDGTYVMTRSWQSGLYLATVAAVGRRDDFAWAEPWFSTVRLTCKPLEDKDLRRHIGWGVFLVVISMFGAATREGGHRFLSFLSAVIITVVVAHFAGAEYLLWGVLAYPAGLVGYVLLANGFEME